MTKLTAEQLLFLEHMAAGCSPTAAALAIGRSNAISWGWARRNPEFAARFAVLHPKYRVPPAAAPLAKSVSQASTKKATLDQLAMQRLEHELRTDGPNAVLAAAAIVLVSPQATPVDSPVFENETSDDADVVPDELQLVSLQSETPSMALSRMLNEVFPLNAPCTYSVDASHARHHIERYYNCNLEVEMQLSSKSISNVLRHHLTERFTIVFEPQLRSHGARIYAVPQPVTLF